MRYILIFFILFNVSGCLSLAARLGIWIDTSSSTVEAPPSSFWKYAYTSTSHKNSYVGGHGFGGTSFDDVDVKLVLSPKNGDTKYILLEHASIPGDSKDGLIYTLVSRNYDLKFSPDGKKLAITYDNNYYGYVGLDLNNDSIVFSRYIKYKPLETDFWKGFPEPEEFAKELLKNKMIHKHDSFPIQANTEQPYFKTVVYSAFQDELGVHLGDFVKKHSENKDLLEASLIGLLEMGNRYLLPEEIPETLSKAIIKYPELGNTIRKYLYSNKMGYDGIGNSFTVFRNVANKNDIDLILSNLEKIYKVYSTAKESGDQESLGWNLKKMLWATADICKKQKFKNTQLEAFLINIIQKDNDDLYNPLHSLQVYAIQALTHMKSSSAKGFITKMSKKYPNKDEIKPELWPKEYTDPNRNNCEWEEQYSNCSPIPISVWLKMALNRI